MISLVSAEKLAERRVHPANCARCSCRGGGDLRVPARALPDAPEIESLVADGITLEAALKKLNWSTATS